MKKIRLIDIAKETGFSIKTISRVVNKRGNVHPDTREAIMKVVNKYNYIPNPIAATLRTKKTKTIGLIVPDFTNQFFGEAALAIERYCKLHGYSLIISFSGNKQEGEEEALRLLVSNYVDGILLASVGTTGPVVKDIIQDERIPLVVFDNEIEGIETNVVMHDNIQGAYALTQHLIDHRYTNIACIAGLVEHTSGALRLEGFYKAIKENNLEVPECNVTVEDWTSEGGFRAMKEFLAREKATRPRAVFVANSVMALGCYKALIQSGVKVPTEIALVSYDNLNYIESLEPPITTLSNNGEAVGEESAKLLFESIEADDVLSTKRITIQGLIIKRQSCGCA